MRKIACTIISLIVAISAYAQIGYSPSYNSRQQQQAAPQQNTENYRTTAYSVDYQGNYIKMPIVVRVSDNGYGGIYLSVVQKYVNTGFGGRWEKIYSGATVSKCTSFIGANNLESNFMYKAIIDTKTWYFDL